MMRALRPLLLCAVLAAVLPGCKQSSPASAAAPQELRVAAASDLTYAFEALAERFQQQTGSRVTLLFGSSGRYARQLSQGAPFDVFASANVSYVDTLVSRGVCDGATKAVYARGALVVWTAEGVAPAASLRELGDARFRSISLADPGQAPYGEAAKQALVSAGLWETLQKKIIFAENIQQALSQVEGGKADAALVARSLTAQSPGRGRAPRGNISLPVEESLHEPLNQALVVCNGGAAKELGRRFAEFVRSPDGAAILSEYGFSPPASAPPQPHRATP